MLFNFFFYTTTQSLLLQPNSEKKKKKKGGGIKSRYQNRRRRRRATPNDVVSLIAESAPEVGFEYLHHADELFHLLQAEAQLGFPRPGSLEPRLRLGEPLSQILHHYRIFVLHRRPESQGIFSRRQSLSAVAHGTIALDWFELNLLLRKLYLDLWEGEKKN
ncbi:hypothetical protein MIMGU_mgv1a015360mg [Erythranthe guttata]|uniref:Uncharacterized protein n=1 Tax=Erythranthe guttata TaxID=4155 RepID=A0A022RGF3_ERYGU|nr:hypothetical protein MIMGU_mgv1a015360mg [Erythranthe guttata]